MIVATLIMAIAVVGLVSAITGSTRNATRLIEHDRAVLLARSKMNELLADKSLSRDLVLTGDFDPARTGGGRAGWRARVSLYERPPQFNPGSLALDRVELEIWWMSADTRRTYTLDGYRSRFLTARDFPPIEGAAP